MQIETLNLIDSSRYLTQRRQRLAAGAEPSRLAGSRSPRRGQLQMSGLVQFAQKILGLGQVRLTIASQPLELLTELFSHSRPGRHRLLLAELLKFFEHVGSKKLTTDAQCFHHRVDLQDVQNPCLAQSLCVRLSRSRRFDVAHSQALAELSKFVASPTLKRPEGRAPTNRQSVDALAQ